MMYCSVVSTDLSLGEKYCGGWSKQLTSPPVHLQLINHHTKIVIKIKRNWTKIIHICTCGYAAYCSTSNMGYLFGERIKCGLSNKLFSINLNWFAFSRIVCSQSIPCKPCVILAMNSCLYVKVGTVIMLVKVTAIPWRDRDA